MFDIRRSVGLIAACAFVGLAGCVASPPRLTSSAERLERNAETLQTEARRDESSSYYRDAQAFADEAHVFRRTVEDRRAGDRDVQEAFRNLTTRYHALRDEAEHSRDAHTEREFNAVTEAYLDVEREMNKQGPRRDRVARD